MTLLLRSVFYTLAITIILSTGTLGLLLPQSLLPAITAPSLLPSLSQSKPKINSSFELALNATDPFTLCYDKADQPDLIRDQCMEALVNSDFAGLPPTDTLTFMPRSPRLVHGQIGLPRRYQSSDGKCAIEPYLTPEASRAFNTPLGFNRAARMIIQDCVSRNSHVGGIAINTGGDYGLEVRIFSFVPRVNCYGSVNRQRMIRSCNNLANKMSTSTRVELFATSEDILVPYTEKDPDGGECQLHVSFGTTVAHPIQYSSRCAIWQAVVAINAMCIRNGQRGEWLSIGVEVEDRGILDVDIGEAEAEMALSTVAATS